MIEIIIALLVGIWIGRTVTNVINQWTFSKILEDLKVTDRQLMELRDQIDGEDTAEIVEIKLEQHQGQLYAFRKDNDQFLGQGPDREQLIQRLKSTFAGKTTVVVREEDGADLIKS
jgi:uncharacterized membrane-anchored protein YhcB (DUF1043 family)